MLCLLRIENFALIDHLELDWQAGLMVLTGETGAGKSIILDALDLALGGKTNARMLRTGCDRASIEATFSMNPALSTWLQEQDIDALDDDTLVCSRELTLGKKSALRSRCRVNGVVQNQSLMADLRQHLVEITAQGQTVELMLPDRQRSLLNSYGGAKLQKQLSKVAIAHGEYLQVKRLIDQRRTSEQERLQRLDLIKFQLQELNEANLESPDELDNLKHEGERLSHVVELQQLSYQTNQILYQNDGGENPAVADLLGDAETLLTEMVEYDPQLDSLLGMVRNALTEIVEVGHQISAYGDNLETDPEHLAHIEARIRELKQICRKYGATLGEAIAGKMMLRRRMIASTLYLGLKKNANQLEAHAWLRVGEEIITGGAIESQFKVISLFGS